MKQKNKGSIIIFVSSVLGLLWAHEIQSRNFIFRDSQNEWLAWVGPGFKSSANHQMHVKNDLANEIIRPFAISKLLKYACFTS